MTTNDPDRVVVRQTQVLSYHRWRAIARAKERHLTQRIADFYDGGDPWPDNVPLWARGVAVRPVREGDQKAKGFVVEATSWKGH